MSPTATAEPIPDYKIPDAQAALEERYERIPLEWVAPSKTNPRTHFDDGYLAELANSILDKGVIQPILVRPLARGMAKDGTRYEVIAGECRFRASRLAQRTHIPAVIREYTDEQVLELQLVENIHRQDLSPLEQAAGYRALIKSNPDKHSAESIAQRIGMSPQWVWDRMKLNDLVPAAKQHLELERISVGHAILIARLKPADQKRVIEYDEEDRHNHGLWRRDAGALDFDEKDPANVGKRIPSVYDELKACSVRELEAFINDHIRFDVAHMAKAAPLEFEPVAAAVAAAEAKPGRGKKVIAIAFDHFLQPEARTDEERTFGPKSFKFADGQEHVDTYPRRKYTAATCEYSVLGVVAAGERRGESFDVCIAREKCRVHWGKEIAAKEKTTKLRERGQGNQADRREAAAAAREAKAEAARKASEARWAKFKPALSKAAHAAAAKLPATLPAPLYAKVLAHHQLPKGTKPAQLAKALLDQAVRNTFDRFSWRNDEPKMVAWAKLLGVDVKACEPKAEPVQTSGVKAAAGTAR